VRPVRNVTRWTRDLPLFWKVLLPFLVLLLLLGTAGTFFLVRGLTDRASQALNRDLTERSLAARSTVHDRELYVLESASFAANLQGIADAVRSGNRDAAASLMQSVLALKTEVTLVAVVNRTGEGIAQFSRPRPGDAAATDPAVSWASSPLVAPVLASPDDTARASFIGFGDRPAVALARTVCGGTESCDPVGAIVVGVDAAHVIAGARHSPGPDADAGVALYDRNSRLVASSGRVPGPSELTSSSGFVRQRQVVDGEEVATLYSPLDLQGERAGSLAVWMPTSHTLADVRSAAVRLAALLLAAMVGVVAIGAALSRFLLAQVRPLVATNRALGAGDLTARAPVLGRDELGELAAGVNQMADALQSSHETLEARVHERTAEVERLLRERTDFFTAVSHEFRTPLAIILGQAEMLSDPSFEKKTAWSAQAGPVLKDAAGQLLDFVNDILEISKADAGRIELNIDEVRVESVLRNLKPAIDQLAASGDIRAEVKVPRRLPPVRADETRMRQVVLDLVDNAVKYTPVGGEVRVTARAVGSSVEILVVDTGVGIPTEEADRLFEPFYRVKGTRTQNGQPSSGLGLALVQRLVEAQGGTVRFDSTPGEGTTFVVALPTTVRRNGAA
jgi:signal transduction histidine kinase